MFVLIVKPNYRTSHTMYFTGTTTVLNGVPQFILTSNRSEAHEYSTMSNALKAKERIKEHSDYEVTLFDTSEEGYDYAGTL